MKTGIPWSKQDKDAEHRRLNDEFARALNEYIEQLKISNNLKQNVMNEENLVFLQNQLRNHGFPETVFPELEKNLNAGKPEFTINLKMQSQNTVLEVTPYFKRGDGSDKYFFNNYKATLKQSAEIPEDREQKFYINNWKGATLKEAFNLLKEAGPVNKNLFPDNGKGQTPWTVLDLGQKTENGNFKIISYPAFDLQKELASYPIKELGDDMQRETLIKSLKKGNSQTAEIERSGGNETMTLRVNAKEGTVDVYNKSGEKMNEVLKNEMNPQQARKEDLNSSLKQDGPHAGIKQENGNGKKMEQESNKLGGPENGENGKGSKKTKEEKIKSLLPQKEVSGKTKGLSV